VIPQPSPVAPALAPVSLFVGLFPFSFGTPQDTRGPLANFLGVVLAQVRGLYLALVAEGSGPGGGPPQNWCEWVWQLLWRFLGIDVRAFVTACPACLNGSSWPKSVRGRQSPLMPAASGKAALPWDCTGPEHATVGCPRPAG